MPAEAQQIHPRLAWNAGRIIDPKPPLKLESTVRYLGIEVDDAIIISEQTDL